MKPLRWIESVNCAIEGILWSAGSQRNLRWHFLAALLVLSVALFLGISALEFILLTFAVSLVLFAELINTAIEVIIDLVSPDYHLLAKRAKDVAAGAVLICACGAAIVGYLALAPSVLNPLGEKLDLLGRVPGETSLIALLVVTILVILLKARFNRGTPLHGGMPSGHAAVAFSIATSITLSGCGPLIALLSLALATMVSHSRLLLKIHTLGEVVVGALLGSAVTAAFHFLLPA